MIAEDTADYTGKRLLLVEDNPINREFAEDVQTAKEAGMDAHIAKPIDIKVMLQTLNSVLKQSE